MTTRRAGCLKGWGPVGVCVGGAAYRLTTRTRISPKTLSHPPPQLLKKPLVFYEKEFEPKRVDGKFTNPVRYQEIPDERNRYKIKAKEEANED